MWAKLTRFYRECTGIGGPLDGKIPKDQWKTMNPIVTIVVFTVSVIANTNLILLGVANENLAQALGALALTLFSVLIVNRYILSGIQLSFAFGELQSARRLKDLTLQLQKEQEDERSMGGVD